ncbi:MAG: hypothetical protein JW861_10195 [Bacteroidales bacterium]|nr:hypothetical protein [Bacteroidales bacterium]
MKKAAFLSLVLLFSVGLVSSQSIPESLTDSLIAWYPFNGNTLDASGHGYDAVNYGATLTDDRFGNPNSAYAFNGISQYMDIPGTESMNFETGGFSLAVWISFTDPAQNRPFIAKHISGIQSGYFLAVRPDEKLQFYLTGEPGLYTSESYNDGQWHLLVGVFDGSTMHLYVDGMLKASQTRNHTNYNSTTIKFGSLDAGPGGPGLFYSGKLDDIRIYNRALTANEVVQLACNECILADISVWLEGPFNGAGMSTGLYNSGYIPLSQPYNVAPWNYAGLESVGSVPSGVVDWILLELRETAGDASTAYEDDVVARQAGFLKDNGKIVSTDGYSPMQFDITVTQKLFAVVYHRNHLAVMSGGELAGSGGIYAYDFTTGASQAYGGATAHIELAPGVWGMTAGDGNADGQVNNGDKNDVWAPQAGSSGYLSGDFSMNGQVDNTDKVDFWKKNSGRSTQVAGAWNCGKPVADDRDGQIYPTVEIGIQCWMAQNLNIGTMINGSGNQTNNGTIEKYCYGNSTANCDTYGGLYQWDEMMEYSTTSGVQGICPDGWHLPTDAEWCTLEQEVDPTITCSSTGWRGVEGGGKLKEAGTTHWAPPNTGATNSSGFTALPGGARSISGAFFDFSVYGYLWSSTEVGSNAWRRGLAFNGADVWRGYDYWGTGCSVRCIRDIQTSWSCGDPLQVTHTAGDVAAVNKTVSYGTVLTDLTGSNQCWITQNLGSDQLATSATDATEASAGWYWQFNRKQGYKHDGTTRTPNTPWITSLNENSDWLPANDPCALLLGTGWRIPTSTEWNNASLNGGWFNVGDAFASVLKMHAAGYLHAQDGNVAFRGTLGYYWSSIQNGTTQGISLRLSSTGSVTANDGKAYGFSLRCILDGPNQPPDAPSNPSPPDNASAQPIDTQLSWSCTDPENDPLTYDVYFGTDDPPATQVSTGQSGTAYDPGTLDYTTTYYWKVVAHDNHSNTTEGPVWSFTTLDEPVWSCGDPLQVSHTAGDVAPVYKTVTYGTVETNLTGINQCWITQNLGSDHQAASVNDATEESAGWYWQFNKKQGYKHDGTTRTPNTTWIYSINENSEWLTDNDPCALLLGTGWRLPTYTEWHYIDENGGWNNYTQTFASELKLHAAGRLGNSTGALSSRGSSGYYWSSIQGGNSNGWDLYFNNSYSYMLSSNKANGFSVRCLRDDAPANQPPNPPSDPNPPDNSTGQPVNTQLFWTCTDPENDPLTFDVFFGNDDPPATQVATGQTGTAYDPGTLDYSTTYYWKVVAHDDHSNTTEGPVWSFTTMDSPVWSCGDPLQVTHTAGDVAPVYKTVTYGTVETNLTGSNKCWITQNLGSDQQAASATDITEASAGWYWQFNRKQGYKHDGTTRTPNTFWISSINENSDWQTANDPCTILLGAGWRLPTYSEWNNADQNGGWSNYNNAYASVLKLHAAGYLYSSGGSLSSRGTRGDYWSSTQSSTTYGWGLFFNSSNCYVNFYDKAIGFSGRCLRD